MSSFDDREKSFENKYKHDEELRFRVQARRNRLLGEWAGRQWGLEGEDLKAYARQVVESDFEKAGDDDVLDKVLADLNANGIETDRRRLRNRMDELLGVAKEQVMQE